MIRNKRISIKLPLDLANAVRLRAQKESETPNQFIRKVLLRWYEERKRST